MWLIVVVKVMLVNVIVGQLLAAVNNLAIAKLEAVPTLNSGFSSMAVSQDTNNPSAVQRSSNIKFLSDVAQDELYLVYRIKRDAIKTKRNTNARSIDLNYCENQMESSVNKCCREQIKSNLLNEKFHELIVGCEKDILWNEQNDTSMLLFNCNQVNITMNNLVCLNECIYRKLDLLDKIGNLIESLLKLHVKNVMSEFDWQKTISDQITEECLMEIKIQMFNNSNNEPDTSDASHTPFSMAKQCNPSALKFAACSLRKFIEWCPRPLQTTITEKCVSTQQNYGYQYDDILQQDFISSRIPSRDHVILGDT